MGRKVISILRHSSHESTNSVKGLSVHEFSDSASGEMADVAQPWKAGVEYAAGIVPVDPIHSRIVLRCPDSENLRLQPLGKSRRNMIVSTTIYQARSVKCSSIGNTSATFSNFGFRLIKRSGSKRGMPVPCGITSWLSQPIHAKAGNCCWRRS